MEKITEKFISGEVFVDYLNYRAQFHHIPH